MSRTRSESNIKFLNSDETKRLFAEICLDTSRHALRNKAIFFLAKYCALRVSEVGLLQVGDYDPLLGKIFCHRLKGSRNNTLCIVDPHVINALNDYFFERKQLNTTNSALFISQKGNSINRKTLNAIMKKYCMNASIPPDKSHFHVLKHTRAMELIEYPKVELRAVQWWLGHKSINNTMIYLEYTSTSMRFLFRYLLQIEGNEIMEETRKDDEYVDKKTTAYDYT